MKINFAFVWFGSDGLFLFRGDLGFKKRKCFGCWFGRMEVEDDLFGILVRLSSIVYQIVIMGHHQEFLVPEYYSFFFLN